MRRRDLIVGAACLAAAGTAEAMRPRNRMSLVHGRKIADAVPLAFAGWRNVDTNAIVAPSENDLASKLYSEQVMRLYLRPNGDYVMMLIAYGDTQSDLLQLHRPEVCYPAFGFAVTATRPVVVPLGPGADVPGRELTASAAERIERITYWARVGEYLPIDDGEQRIAKLRSAFNGVIPDGVLVRFSNNNPDERAAFALNRRFAADLVAAMRPDMRPALVTSNVAQALKGRA